MLVEARAQNDSHDLLVVTYKKKMSKGSYLCGAEKTRKVAHYREVSIKIPKLTSLFPRQEGNNL